MKIRLSQSKCRSTADRASRRAINLVGHTFLQPLHLRRTCGRFVIVTAEVKETVRDIQMQLVLKRCLESAGLTPGSLRAHEYLAMLERDDIGGTGCVKEAKVKLRNPPVGDQNDIDFFKRR